MAYAKPKPQPHHIARCRLMHAKGYGVRDIAETVGITQPAVRRILGLVRRPTPTLEDEARRMIRQGYHRDIVRAVVGYPESRRGN